MLVLGFDRHARALIALSTLLPHVRARHYYGLNLTLLRSPAFSPRAERSALMASGFVRYRYRGYHAQDAHEEPA